MPAYLTHQAAWESLWPLPVTALLVTAIVVFFARLFFKDVPIADMGVTILAFSLLGLVTGMLTGMSREPAVGAIIPAVLSLVGGLAIYMIGKELASRILVNLAVIALAFNLILGTTWGAIQRVESAEYYKSARYLLQRAEIEAAVNVTRSALGLQPLSETGTSGGN